MATIEELADRVERLLLRHEELQRTNALLATQLLSGLLFQVRATDPFTYTLIAALLALTAAIAAWRPARRAAAVDPITALRAD